jgi:hypothetical protein
MLDAYINNIKMIYIFIYRYKMIFKIFFQLILLFKNINNNYLIFNFKSTDVTPKNNDNLISSLFIYSGEMLGTILRSFDIFPF